MTLPLEVPLLVAGSAPWETPAPVNAHQVARRFAGRGHRVLYLESTGLRPPAPAGSGHDRTRILRRLARLGRGPREVAPGLMVGSPLALPGSRNPQLRRRSLHWIASHAARACRRLELERPLVWAFLPTAVRVADAVQARGLVYHCVDDYAANPGTDAAWVAALESEMLGRADLVLASSPTLAERLARQRPDVVCVPNVADVTLFSRAVHEALPEPVALRGVARPRLVYVGNLAGYRIDAALLRRTLERLPDAALVLIGAVGLGESGGLPEALASLLQQPAVVQLDAVPQEELPALLAHCDVALIPFLDNAHTRASLPLKLWEYAAAGLPVVASELPNLGAAAQAGVVRLAHGPGDFADQVAAALVEPGGDREAISARARDHGWEARIEELSALAAAVVKA